MGLLPSKKELKVTRQEHKYTYIKCPGILACDRLVLNEEARGEHHAPCSVAFPMARRHFPFEHVIQFHELLDSLWLGYPQRD